MVKSKKTVQIIRWVMALPVWLSAWTFSMTILNFSIYYFRLPYFVNSKAFSFVWGTLSLLISTTVAGSLFLRLLPKYQKSILIFFAISYMLFQTWNTSRFGMEYFSFIFAFGLGCFFSYSLLKKGEMQKE